MAYFTHKSRDYKGRLKKGKIKAYSKREAEANLKKDGLVPLEIAELEGLFYKDLHIGKPVSNKDFVIYLRQFSTLINAGISLVESTYILKDQTASSGLKRTLTQVAVDLEAGRTFTEAAEKHPGVFPSLLINMLKAGESGGDLDEILDRMAVYYESQFELKQKVLSALSYPLAVGMIAIGIIIFMLSFVVPRFQAMLTSLGGTMPPFTQFILGLSELLQQFWWAFILLPLIIAILYRYGLTHPKISYYYDLIKMRIPLIGPFIQKAALARMTRTLSALFSSSVPVLESLEITRKVVNNKVLEEELKKSQRSVEGGESLAKPLLSHWAFPSLVTQMIILGEKTGALDTLLGKAADFYEKEMDHGADRLKTLIEPVMIIGLALIVGAIVIAIALPMLSIFENV